MTGSDRLIILDYSGTLSLLAPRFAQPERLARELAASGLGALGISTPEVFWERIVNPTWVEGSTTQRGYAKVMTERIIALGMAPATPRETIATAAGRFVDRYLAHSSIDLRWRPILARLAEDRSAVTVIATDHYAEATAAIGRFLAQLNVALFVANSADLGAWKGERRFWEALRNRLPLAEVRRVLAVDDFGLHEEKGDRYSGRKQALSRQQRTIAMLAEVFGAEVESIPFFLEHSLWEDQEAESCLIASTTAGIAAFLERK